MLNSKLRCCSVPAHKVILPTAPPAHFPPPSSAHLPSPFPALHSFTPPQAPLVASFPPPLHSYLSCSSFPPTVSPPCPVSHSPPVPLFVLLFNYYYSSCSSLFSCSSSIFSCSSFPFPPPPCDSFSFCWSLSICLFTVLRSVLSTKCFGKLHLIKKMMSDGCEMFSCRSVQGAFTRFEREVGTRSIGPWDSTLATSLGDRKVCFSLFLLL